VADTVSRVRRAQVGLNIVCHDHRDIELFWPRMATDGTWRMWDAGTRGILHGVAGPNGEFKYSRRCPWVPPADGSTSAILNCKRHPEFKRQRVRTVMVALVRAWLVAHEEQSVPLGTRFRDIFVVTDVEMTRMIRRPMLAATYLGQLVRASPDTRTVRS
jgi:hypothetical protein